MEWYIIIIYIIYHYVPYMEYIVHDIDRSMSIIAISMVVLSIIWNKYIIYIIDR